MLRNRMLQLISRCIASSALQSEEYCTTMLWRLEELSVNPPSLQYVCLPLLPPKVTSQQALLKLDPDLYRNDMAVLNGE
jgi:hypothetical protein